MQKIFYQRNVIKEIIIVFQKVVVLYRFNLLDILRREKIRRVYNTQGSRLYFSQTCLERVSIENVFD